MVSIILPAYNEEKMIQKSADTISDILRRAEIPFEIVFVNDGSKDCTWSEIEQVSKKNENIHGLDLKKQQLSLMSGNGRKESQNGLLVH